MTTSYTPETYEQEHGTDVYVIAPPPISGPALELIQSAIYLSGWTTRTGLLVGGRTISAVNGLLKILVRWIPESALTVNDSYRMPTPFRGGS